MLTRNCTYSLTVAMVALARSARDTIGPANELQLKLQKKGINSLG